MAAVTASETDRLRAKAAAAIGDEVSVDEPTVHEDRFVHSSVHHIGSAGVLLDRTTGRVYVLGSAHSAEKQIWAIKRGFDLDGENRLVITKVHDLEATIQVLKQAFSPRWLRSELAPRLANPPVSVDVDPAGFWRLLYALPDTSAFDYEVNP
jgi:hypothetical protein